MRSLSKRRTGLRPQFETLEDRFAPALLIGLSDNNTLVAFDSGTPTPATPTAITGLNPSENVLGIDYRPANGLLYGITNQNRVLTISRTTGAVSGAVALTADPADTTNAFTALNGTSFGVDFNPVPDRLRVVSNTNQNLRINVDTGRVITDDDLNPGAPDVVASAYLNNFAGTPNTTLYGLDDDLDRLVIQSPPNAGTLATVGATLGAGLNVTLDSGFEIVTTGDPTGRVNTAFASLSATGVVGLYQVDLTTGSAALAGVIGTGTTPIRGLAAVPVGTLNFSVSSFSANENGGTATITVTRTGGSFGAVDVSYATTSATATAGEDFTPVAGSLMFADGDMTAKTFTIALLDDQISEGNESVLLQLSGATNGAVIGVRGTAALSIRDNEAPSTYLYTIDGSNVLREFDSATPGVIRRTINLLGLNTGDVIEGIDIRPATGQLYGLVVNGSTSRLITINRLTGVVSNVAPLSADSTDMTLPFTTLAGTDFGFDFNPTNDRLRIVSNTGANLNVSPTTGQVITQTDITGGGPNVVGAAYTNSFVGAGSTRLLTIDSSTDSLYEQNPAGGTLTLIGALGVDTTGLTGFDIAPFNNEAFAALTAPSGTDSQLYSIDTATGTASLISTIAGGSTINGLAAFTINDLNLTATQRYVNRLFLDLLGRNADPTGLQNFSAFIDQGGSRQAAVDVILNSQEYRANAINDLYQRYLRRDVESTGMTQRLNELASGITLVQITDSILASDEYFNLNGGTNAGFLNALYRDVLGRAIDSTGQTAFTNFLQSGGSRADIVRAITSSDEFAGIRVQSLYRNLLLRDADTAGFNGFVDFLQDGGSVNQLIAIFTTSSEYLNQSA